MQVKLRKRYYCDFCKKSGGSKYHMQRHETGCTANPKRDCGLCRAEGNVSQSSMEDLREALREDIAAHVKAMKLIDNFWDELNIKANIEKLRAAANNCPACILAAIRQENPTTMIEFTFADEKTAWWNSVNAARERVC